MAAVVAAEVAAEVAAVEAAVLSEPLSDNLQAVRQNTADIMQSRREMMVIVDYFMMIPLSYYLYKDRMIPSL